MRLSDYLIMDGKNIIKEINKYPKVGEFSYSED